MFIPAFRFLIIKVFYFFPIVNQFLDFWVVNAKIIYLT